MSIGRTLSAAREDKGLTVLDVAAATRINKKYIQALEDENFLLIPSQVFAKGFLKTYSAFLGLDYKKLIDELALFYKNREDIKRSFLLPQKPKQAAKPSVAFKMPKPPKLSSVKISKDVLKASLVATSLLVLMLAAYGIFLKIGLRPAHVIANPPPVIKVTPVKVMPVAKATPVKAKPVKETPKPFEMIPGKVQIRLETVERSWVNVTAGDKELYSQTLDPGVKLNFIGREITVKVGNGAGVKATVDGKPLGVMGEDGVAVERTFKAQQ